MNVIEQLNDHRFLRLSLIIFNKEQKMKKYRLKMKTREYKKMNKNNKEFKMNK